MKNSWLVDWINDRYETYGRNDDLPAIAFLLSELIIQVRGEDTSEGMLRGIDGDYKLEWLRPAFAYRAESSLSHLARRALRMLSEEGLWISDLTPDRIRLQVKAYNSRQSRKENRISCGKKTLQEILDWAASRKST